MRIGGCCVRPAHGNTAAPAVTAVPSSIRRDTAAVGLLQGRLDISFFLPAFTRKRSHYLIGTYLTGIRAFLQIPDQQDARAEPKAVLLFDPSRIVLKIFQAGDVRPVLSGGQMHSHCRFDAGKVPHATGATPATSSPSHVKPQPRQALYGKRHSERRDTD
jgi:hypothetical protein